MAITNDKIKQVLLKTTDKYLEYYYSVRLDLSVYYISPHIEKLSNTSKKSHHIEEFKQNIEEGLDSEKQAKMHADFAKIVLLGGAGDELYNVLQYFEEKEGFLASLSKIEEITAYDLAFALLLNKPALFSRCVNIINYSPKGKTRYQKVTITSPRATILEDDSNIKALISDIADFNSNAISSNQEVKHEYDAFTFNGREFIKVYTAGSAEYIQKWESTKKICEKYYPVLEVLFVYSPQDGELEVSLPKGRKKANELLDIFTRTMLGQEKISHTNFKPAYNLRYIKDKILELNDDGHVILQSEDKSIQLYVTSIGMLDTKGVFLFLNVNKGYLSHLNTYRDLIRKCELLSVEFKVDYQEEKKQKHKVLKLGRNTSDLEHYGIDAKIRQTLKENKIEEIPNKSLVECMKLCLQEAEVSARLNLYNLAFIHGLSSSALQQLVNFGYIELSGEITEEKLYCIECKEYSCKLEESGIICQSCYNNKKLDNNENALFSNLYRIHYAKFREDLFIAFKDFKIREDSSIKEQPCFKNIYLGSIKYGKTSKIHIYFCRDCAEVNEVKASSYRDVIIITTFEPTLEISDKTICQNVKHLIEGFDGSRIIFSKDGINALRQRFIPSGGSEQVILDSAIEIFNEHKTEKATFSEMYASVNEKLSKRSQKSIGENRFRDKVWRVHASDAQKAPGKRKSNDTKVS